MSVELEVVSKFCFLFLLVALAECLRANGMVWQKSATLSPQSDERKMNMKKIMLIAAAAAGLAVMADGVESGIVGYNTISIAANSWYLIGTQFKDVTSETDAIPINKLCSVNGVEAGTFANRNDALQMQVYNGTGYTTYYYISDATGATGPCWTNTRRALADTVTLPLGSAFWMKTPVTVQDGANVLVAGGVKMDATTKDVSVGASEWTQVANPFPVELTLGSLTTSGLTAGTFANRNNAPQIQVYNGVGYTTYYYISDATGATGNTWTNTRRALADTTVLASVGQGFWVKSSVVGTLTFALQ